MEISREEAKVELLAAVKRCINVNGKLNIGALQMDIDAAVDAIQPRLQLVDKVEVEVLADAKYMELRDRMAMAALTGILAAKPRGISLPKVHTAAYDAYGYADAMLAEREKKPSGIYKDEEGDKTGMAHRYCDACGKMIGAPGGCEGHSPLEREKDNSKPERPVEIGFDGPNNTRITGRVVGEDGGDWILDAGELGLIRREKQGKNYETPAEREKGSKE